MKKHISLVIVFSILLLALTNISPPVKAKQEIQQTEYLAIDIYGNQLPNSKYQNGLYEKGLLISPYDFIFTDLSIEQKENAFFSYSGFDDYIYLSYNSGTDEEIEKAEQNFMLRTGMSEDGTYHFPFFYITSIKEFESYLIDSGYIREGESWKDIDISEFGSRLEILERLEEKKLGYLISKNNIPGYFYQSSYISSNTNILELNIIYKIDELYDYYICNSKISYTNSSSSDDLIYEKSELTLPDSFGKIKAISANKFIYEYSILRYNNEFGYYGYKQDDEIYTIELNINQVPSFLFDSKGNLKDDYVSFKNNFWYLIKVSDVSDELKVNWDYTFTIVGESQTSEIQVVRFWCYFDFNLPVDTIEYLKFELEMINDGINVKSKNNLKAYLAKLFGKEFFPDRKTYVIEVYRDSKIMIPQTTFIDPNSILLPKFSIIPFKNYKEVSEIQVGEFLLNNKKYDLLIPFISEDYDHSLDKYVDDNYGFALFDYNSWIPSSGSQILHIKYSYKSIIYEAYNVPTIPDFSLPENPSDRKNLIIKILEFLNNLWNWNYPYGMFIILGFLAVCIILIIIYFPGLFKILLNVIIFPFKILIKLFLLLINFFKKKKE